VYDPVDDEIDEILYDSGDDGDDEDDESDEGRFLNDGFAAVDKSDDDGIELTRGSFKQPNSTLGGRSRLSLTDEIRLEGRIRTGGRGKPNSNII